MKAKVIVTALFAAALFLFAAAFEAQAGLEPVQTVDNLFTAVNAGDLDAASAFFAADAVATVKATNRSYEIGRYLQSLHRPGRTYEIVQLAWAGDTVNLTVDIADRGHVWGQQKLIASVRDGAIESLDVVETRLTLWRINN